MLRSLKQEWLVLHREFKLKEEKFGSQIEEEDYQDYLEKLCGEEELSFHGWGQLFRLQKVVEEHIHQKQRRISHNRLTRKKTERLSSGVSVDLI